MRFPLQLRSMVLILAPAPFPYGGAPSAAGYNKEELANYDQIPMGLRSATLAIAIISARMTGS